MIQVLFNYGGKPTQEKRIPAGVYEEDDEALLGLADYLVEMGIAIRLGGGNRPGRKSTRLAPSGEKGKEDES